MTMAKSLAKTYDPSTVEPRLSERWQREGIYLFDRASDQPVYAIDTPPATVSGHLHLGHAYSYTHPDIIARFWRMNGHNVFYPMGFDDNGLPTERLVEKRLGITAPEVGRQAFIERCMEVGVEAEDEYRTLWQRLGLSIDWRFSYRSIDTLSRRTSQQSFLDLYRRGLAYQQEAPTIWCPECRTAIAQAELDDLERQTTFYTLAFALPDGATLPIATTRPELLPACVAIFVHPDDARYAAYIGSEARVPLLGRSVPLLTDPLADPDKGTGAVMCCTFGDANDVEWWRTHQLPLRAIIGRDGRLTDDAGDLAGMTTSEARMRIIEQLRAAHLLLGEQTHVQSVRVHERCDTPVEYLVARQWFIRVLDHKEKFLAAGEQIHWRPAHMAARYREWVENLKWDWCISRQRYFGVPFPVWRCDACGAILLADDADLPIDPTTTQPGSPCACGSTSFTPDGDMMDTWATSSMSPQIVGQWLADPALYQQVFPFALRPQAHEIIRTWAFYTIVKSLYMFDTLPWREVAISGWGLAPEGAGKISKSRGGGTVMSPGAMIGKYSADAVRYWAASTGFGKDTIISEERIQAGAKLATKLWNVARLSEHVLAGYTLPETPPALAPTDHWLLARLRRLVERVTTLFTEYDYASAKSETESFFWTTLADNYLELAKMRLYDATDPLAEGARYALRTALLTVLKLFAPFLPYVTEEIYTTLFADEGGSIHRSTWPTLESLPTGDGDDEAAIAAGDALVAIATAVRRYKSEHGLSLGRELARLQIATDDATLADILRASLTDLRSVTRAALVEVGDQLDPSLQELPTTGIARIAIQP